MSSVNLKHHFKNLSWEVSDRPFVRRDAFVGSLSNSSNDIIVNFVTNSNQFYCYWLDSISHLVLATTLQTRRSIADLSQLIT